MHFSGRKRSLCAWLYVYKAGCSFASHQCIHCLCLKPRLMPRGIPRCAGSLIHAQNLNGSVQQGFPRFLVKWQCNQRGTGAAGGQDYLTPAAGHRERAGHRKRMGAAQQRCFLRTSSGDIYCTRSQMMPRGNHQRASSWVLSLPFVRPGGGIVRASRAGACECRSHIPRIRAP